MARERPNGPAGCTIEPGALFQYLSLSFGGYLGKLLLPVFEENREDFEDLYWQVLNEVVVRRDTIDCLRGVSTVEELDGSPDRQHQLLGYIRTTAVHSICHWRRGRSRGSDNPAIADNPAIPNDLSKLAASRPPPTEALSFERVEKQQQVRDILRRLSEPDRELLMRKMMMGECYEDIARDLNKSVGAVRTAFSRACERFRDLWKQVYGDGPL